MYLISYGPIAYQCAWRKFIPTATKVTNFCAFFSREGTFSSEHPWTYKFSRLPPVPRSDHIPRCPPDLNFRSLDLCLYQNFIDDEPLSLSPDLLHGSVIFGSAVFFGFLFAASFAPEVVYMKLRLTNSGE